jgi:RimJ/RimL family protein N-acetyltransferase
MAEKKEFQWLQPPFMLMPYVVQEGMFAPEDLISLHNRIKEEGLWDTVFHDNPQMNLLEFMNFFSARGVMLQIIHTVEGDVIQDKAAIAWLSGVEQYGDSLRAIASFCVFRDYQNPVIVDRMAKMVFSYWFDELGMEIVIGMTPESNSHAVNFIKRIGFIEIGRIPKYSYLKGSKTPCVITYMDNEQYKTLYGGK